MEYLVDRSSYRRNVDRIEDDECEDKKFSYKILRKLCIQSIGAIIVVIALYTCKIFKVQVVLDFIEHESKKNIPIETIYEEGKNGVINFCKNVFKEEAKTVENGNNETDNTKINEVPPTVVNENLEPIMSISTDVSTEPVYETAVEGINQMSEDAIYVKKNYKLKYPLPFKAIITSCFGVRQSENPIVTPYHSGTDLAADKGTNIYAALDGTVIKATTDEAYGKYVMIKTDDVVTLYAHCSKLKVKLNQKVKKGDVIAEVGSTGWATGPHLHFEIRVDGRLVNPADILNLKE